MELVIAAGCTASIIGSVTAAGCTASIIGSVTAAGCTASIIGSVTAAGCTASIIGSVTAAGCTASIIGSVTAAGCTASIIGSVTAAGCTASIIGSVTAAGCTASTRGHPAVTFPCRVVDSDTQCLLNVHWTSSVGGPSGLSNHSACLPSHTPCFSAFLLLLSALPLICLPAFFAMSATTVLCFTSKAAVGVVSWTASF